MVLEGAFRERYEATEGEVSGVYKNGGSTRKKKKVSNKPTECSRREGKKRGDNH